MLMQFCWSCAADALVRAGMPCRVLALINDSVGVLTASCYFDQATEMGVILGTGTNACIVVPVSIAMHESSAIFSKLLSTLPCP